MWWAIAGCLGTVLVILSTKDAAAEDGELLISIVVFREGDRTPLITLDNDPNNDKWGAEGKGQVTTVGKKKMYEFGRYLRTRYHKTLTRRRITTRTIHIRSVRYERNLVTAQMVLNGLMADLPQNNIPSIQIHTEDLNKDKIMMTDSCPAYDKELNKSIAEKKIFNQIDENEQSFYKKIESNSNCDCHSFHDVKRCIDPLFCEASEGLKLPKWCNETCFRHMRELYDKDLEAEVCTPKLMNLKVQPFMEEIIKRLRVYGHGPEETPFQLFMYSGMEDTIPLIMKAIGVTNLRPHIPEFGASLIIEMRRVESEKVMSFFYKTSTSSYLKKLSIRGCGMVCEFNNFVNLLPPILKKRRFAC